eukprot:3419180-Prymnesium_polylepis.1
MSRLFSLTSLQTPPAPCTKPHDGAQSSLVAAPDPVVPYRWFRAAPRARAQAARRRPAAEPAAEAAGLAASSRHRRAAALE